MKKTYFVPMLAAAFFCALLPASPVQSADKKQPTPAELRAQLAKDVPATIATYKKADPGIDRFFKDSAGYVVFPRVGKVGLIIAGGDGAGELYEKGKLAGTASITVASIGLQAGAQEFSQIVFFKDAAAVERFKQNKFEFAANASAVIIKAGASGGADYRDGVVVFTRATSGAMFEASLGTQKFSFTAEAAPATKDAAKK
jgi:lipid-binding SYLF domain-containing protein